MPKNDSYVMELEEAISNAVDELLDGNPVGAYRVLAPYVAPASASLS